MRNFAVVVEDGISVMNGSELINVISMSDRYNLGNVYYRNEGKLVECEVFGTHHDKEDPLYIKVEYGGGIMEQNRIIIVDGYGMKHYSNRLKLQNHYRSLRRNVNTEAHFH